MAQVNIPDDLYQRLKERAEEHHRSVEAQLLKTLSAGLVVEEEELPADITDALTALETADDEALWRVARSRVPLEMAEAVQKLRTKQKRASLTSAEQFKLDELLHQYDLIMLLRAKAAVLLKQHGYDVNVLLTEA
ncbi:MAG TPA: Arc family DNA-binding protein [Ktedonobacterales bacterium]|jgi:plasmid stability protein